MAGGLIQLSAVSNQNQYLNGNPQFTYFQSVYKRYTNFSMEMVQLLWNGPIELSVDHSTILSATLDRVGDLVNGLYFEFTLPNIYSGYNTTLPKSLGDYAGYRFAWIENIGINIIESCTIKIGGKKISTLYGDWIRIWHELFSGYDMKTFDEMTGNVPDVFAPRFSVSGAGVYPTSTLDPALNTDPELFTYSHYLQNPYLKPPSILGRTITVPLNFWFTTHPGLALPLVSLQYDPVTIEIELRPLCQLYTIRDTDPTSPSFGRRIVPSSTNPAHAIRNFISLQNPNTFTYGNHLGIRDGDSFTGFGFAPSLLVNYIFLEESERESFVDDSKEYLIEQVTRQQFIGQKGSTKLTLGLQTMAKVMVWVAERDDFVHKNIFGNFTNWEFPSVMPGSNSYLTYLFSDTSLKYVNGVPVLVDTPYAAYEADAIPHKFNFHHFKHFPIEESTIFFNGQERFSTRPANFFNYLQPIQHKAYNSLAGVNVYSFSLDLSKYQPSGASTMSAVQKIELAIKLTEIPQVVSSTTNQNEMTDAYLYNISVFTLGYNIFRSFGGKAGLTFTS